MRRSTGWAWTSALVVAGLVTAAAVVLAAAPLVGIERWHGIAAALPARAGLAAAAVVGLVVTGVLALPWRARPVAVPLALSLALAAALHAPVVLARGLTTEPIAAADDGQLRLLEWNTNGELVTPQAIAELSAQHRATVVVLPQKALRDRRATYQRAFEAAGLPMVKVSTYGYPVQVAVWVTPALAPAYPTAVPGPDPSKSVVLTSADPSLPTLVALHAPWPVLDEHAGWRRDLDWVAQQCATDAPVVVAGDFNASTDDFGGPRLGRCEDAAALRGSSAAGTWPTWLPTALAMPIDHVLLTPAAGTVTSFTALTAQDGSGARHRPTMTVITPHG